MADDWQVGDRALCVSVAPHWSDMKAPGDWSPSVGAVYRVSRAGLCRFGLNSLLALDENPNGIEWGFLAFRFIKVTPDAEDAFDREVIAHMAGQEVDA